MALACCGLLIAYGPPALGRSVSAGDRGAESSAAREAAPVTAAPPSRCPEVQHWDPGMRMCMPNAAAVENGKSVGLPPQPRATVSASPVLADTPPGPSACPPDRPFDAKMNMCMPGGAGSEPLFTFQLNQFLVYSDTFGPRGQSRPTGPGMWMLMYAKALSPRNQLRIDLMGSAEPLTVGDRGTPQLLQTEHVDSMHAHDTVMALEFRDVLTLDAQGAQTLTFLFAPRGEAAVGPVPFMHRESAEGNPDAPLGHNLQDGFHDVSTVIGLAYETGPTSRTPMPFG
jgi:hypothetical protein